jgi:hypothetical protein
VLDNRITIRDRWLSADYIAWLAEELNAAADWLGDQGLEVEADEAEQAARRAAKVAWMVARPLLRDPAPSRWQQARGPNGPQHGPDGPPDALDWPGWYAMATAQDGHQQR